MGGGPDKEHLLIVLWDPELKELTAELKRRFPSFDITYIHQALKESFVDDSTTVPDGETFPSQTVWNPRGCAGEAD